MYLNDVRTDNPQSITDMLTFHFATAHTFRSVTSPVFEYVQSILLLSLDVNISDIFPELNKLDTSKEPGIEGIPSNFLKSCSFILRQALWIIFGVSKSSETFSSEWKSNYVRLVFESGD